MNDVFELIPTNTLVSGAFDVLKMDAVEDPFTHTLSATAMNMEESCFASAIENLKSINGSYLDAKIKLYEAMARSTGSAVMLESFSDYYVQVDAIIQKFLKFIRFKIDEFIDTVYHYMDETTVITEHKKQLTEEIKWYDDDSMEGHDFTIDEKVPDLSLIDSFNASLFDELYKPHISDLSVDSVKETIMGMELENDIQVFRAKILGIDGTLSDSEFIRTLYMVFRNNASGMVELQIDAKDIRTIAERWFKHYEIKQTLNAQYNAIEKAYNSILKKVGAICKDNNGMSVAAFTNLMPGDLKIEKIEGKDVDAAGVMMSPDMMLQVDIYTKAKIDQLQKYSDITCMTLTAKMDAIKDMIRQDRAILLNAIEVIDHPDQYYDPCKIPKEPKKEEKDSVEALAPVDEGVIKKWIEAGKKKKAAREAAKKEAIRFAEEEKKYREAWLKANEATIKKMVSEVCPTFNSLIKTYYSDLSCMGASEIISEYNGTYLLKKNSDFAVQIFDSDYPDAYWNNKESEDDDKAWNIFCDKMDNFEKKINQNAKISKWGKIYMEYIDDSFSAYMNIKSSLLNWSVGREDSNND